MKIGILGTRGIPNAYGGFEQFAQYLAQGLLKKGHEVYVYNSDQHPYKEKIWNGIHLIHCKDPEDKIGTAGQFIYDYYCLKDARKRAFDVLLQLGYTSNSIWHWLWPGKNTINIVNMDGLEWKRSKYGKLTQRFLQYAEKWAARHADILIADSIGIQEHILKTYYKESIYIPYGAEIPESTNKSILAKWGLEVHQYFLLIARMEPENNVEMIIKGYLASFKPYPLIIIGNPTNKFGQYLMQQYQHENVRFIGAVYEQEAINSIRYYSFLYFHGHSVGGTNPSLLEAMACGCNIAAHGNIFNCAILNNNASYFLSDEDVKGVIDNPESQEMISDRRIKNIDAIKSAYNWEKIINDYEQVFTKALENKVSLLK